MTLYKNKILFILLVSTVAMYSCKKEDSRQDCNTTITTLSGTYKITALKYKASASSQEMDYLPFLDDCEKDNQVKLNANKTYHSIDAGMVCDPSSDSQGTWNLVGNKIESDGQIQGDIQSFDCTTLVVFSTNTIIPGDKLTFTFQKL